jgi:hypothetical protein
MRARLVLRLRGRPSASELHTGAEWSLLRARRARHALVHGGLSDLADVYQSFATLSLRPVD